MKKTLLAAFVALLFPVLALAQAPAPKPVAGVDLSPLVTEVVWPIVTLLVPVLAVWLARKLARLLDLKSDEPLRAVFETAAQNALAKGKARIAGLPPGALTIDAKSAAVAEASTYVVAHIPDTLKALNVTPEALREKLQARLERDLQAPPPAAVLVKA